VLSVTPTKLRDFLTCPQLYKLRHVDRVASDGNPVALAFGRSLHAALEELHRVGGEGRASSDPDQLLRRHWESWAYADAAESEEQFAKGRDALRRYMDGPPAGQVLGTEVFMGHVFNLRGLQIRMGCKADRVGLLPGGVLEVTDYKTNASGRLPTRESLLEDLPTFLYYVLARITYPQYDRVRVSFLNLLTLATVSVSYDADRVAANKQALLVNIRAFASGAFGPRPGEACAWCDVLEHCPNFGRQIDFDSLT
jgi:putative RecB family exonuclease